MGSALTIHGRPVVPATRPAPSPRFDAISSWLARHSSRMFQSLTRPYRVVVVLAAVWVLNGFDLAFTLHEVPRGFTEANPVAALLLGGPPELVVAYKAKLVLWASLILIGLRQHRLTEWACWFLLAAYCLVALRWASYYEGVSVVLGDPALNYGLDLPF